MNITVIHTCYTVYHINHIKVRRSTNVLSTNVLSTNVHTSPPNTLANKNIMNDPQSQIVKIHDTTCKVKV